MDQSSKPTSQVPDDEIHPLRSKALRWLKVHGTAHDTDARNPDETEQLLEELRIYQAELEVQNDELRAAQTQTAQLLQRFSLLFQQAPVSMLLVDRYGLIKQANADAVGRFKLTNHQARHHLLSRQIAESSRHMVESALSRADDRAHSGAAIPLRDVEMIDGEGEMLRGDLVVLRLPRSDMADPNQAAEFLCVYSDHTALSSLSRELAAHNQMLRLYEQAFEQVSEAIMVTDLRGHIVSVNRAFTRITGYEAQEVMGQNAHMLASGQTPADTYRQLWECLARDGRWVGELSNRRRDGIVYPEWISIETLHDDDGNPWRYVATFQDLTLSRAQEATLQRLAQEDALTGLPNRHIMPTLVNQAFDRARRAGSKAAMIFVDLDNFKNINDSLGHLVGDETLVLVAQRLQERLRDADTLIRLGGDEFLVVAENLRSATDASHLAQSLLDSLGNPLLLGDGRKLFVSCSMGVGLFPDDGENAEELLQEADTAMYRAKSNGRGRFELFSPALMRQVKEEFELTTDLRQAIQRAEFFLEFQPLVPTQAGLPVEVEALVRWAHPTRGMLSPNVFIGVAERSGLLGDLSLQVLDASCRALRGMLDAQIDIAAVAVNVSLRDLESSRLAHHIEQALSTYQLEGSHLKLELTERDLMRNVAQTQENLERIRKLGVRVAVDDFGTGFSSLAYLHLLPLDALKIDASFVASIETDETAQSIVETIVALGKALRLKLVAEGVETSGQVERLKRLGVDYLQGWHFCRAVPADRLFETLADLPTV